MSIYQSTLAEISKMALSEKISLVEEIWDTIVKDGEYPELTEQQSAELNRRMNSYHTNPSQGRLWSDIKSEYWKSTK
jgi:putative addiction module component (TIGR02574 family)